MYRISIVNRIKAIGWIIVSISSIIEIILFDFYPNVLGCAMTVFCWALFVCCGLNVEIIKRHLFSWLMYLSMALYRVLPLPLTLLEGKNVAWNFMCPYETFLGESFLFLICSFAFYLCSRSRQPNFFERISERVGMFKMGDHGFIVFLGFVGVLASLFEIIANYSASIGDILGKFIEGFSFCKYAPIILCFPRLLHNDETKKNDISFLKIVYILVLVVFSFSIGKRTEMLYPFATFVLLYFVNTLLLEKHIVLKLVHVVSLFLCIFILFPLVRDLSDIMLYYRKDRGELTKIEMMKKTIDVFSDENLMKKVKQEKKELEDNEIVDYSEKWDELYLDNFTLNRFCNIKITDITMWHANRIGWGNKSMQKDYIEKILKIFPQPVLDFFNIYVDKREQHSRGDWLYYLSSRRSSALTGLRVTSHLSDGLATFSYFYFVVQFVFLLLMFSIVDSFILYKKGIISYSVYGLCDIYGIFILFRNAQGAVDAPYLLIRGFWQTLFVMWVLFRIFKLIFR